MFVVFEGIDGSGKTTISNRVVRRLKANGVKTRHLREDGKFASNVTEAVRSLARDARNLALVPEAELLLYAARELQLTEEALRPALAAGALVVADRYFYTAEVLGRFGRGLDAGWVSSVLELARRGLTPDLVVLIDVDPALARARRKASKLNEPASKPPSRKGLAGVGLAQRLRQGYLELARAQPERFVVVDNDAELETSVARVQKLIESARERGVAAALAEFRSTRVEAKSLSEGPTVERFLERVGQRADVEPGVAAVLLTGFHGPRIDALRERLALSAPRAVLHALTSLSDELSFSLRQRLAAEYPAEVARSLTGVVGEPPEAWQLRAKLRERAGAEVALSLHGLASAGAFELRRELSERHPDAVIASFAGQDAPEVWELRERYLESRRAELASSLELCNFVMRSVRGLGDARAWQLRDRCWAVAPVAVLKSLWGLDDERAWQMRRECAARAPRPVLGSLGLLRTEQAWAMRSAAVASSKEALDGMAGADEPEAWSLRERAADLWPSTVVKSIGTLRNSARGQALFERQLARHGHDLAVQRNASLLELCSGSEASELED